MKSRVFVELLKAVSSKCGSRRSLIGKLDPVEYTTQIIDEEDDNLPVAADDDGPIVLEELDDLDPPTQFAFAKIKSEDWQFIEHSA